MIVYNIQRHSAYGQRATANRRLTTFTFGDMKMAGNNPTRLTTIYTLSDPETGEVRYVGKTIMPLSDRLIKHIYSARIGINHRCCWIHSLLDKGLIPIIQPIESGVIEKWAERECFWISYYRDRGTKLVNGTDGGDGAPGLKHTDESIEKMRISHLGKKASAETRTKMKVLRSDQEYRKRISDKMKGIKLSDDARAKIKDAMNTPECKKKISISSKGRSLSVESRVKISSALKGRKRPDDVRAKISAAHIGIKPSAETRALMSVNRKGRIHTDETRAKMRASHKMRLTSQEQLSFYF